MLPQFTLKKYKTHQSAGGSSSSSSACFYSTPKYMGFTNGLYIAKYGKLGPNSELVLNKTQQHYNKTMKTWTERLKGLNVHGVKDVIDNLSTVQKALRTRFRIVPNNRKRGKHLVGGRVVQPVLIHNSSTGNQNSVKPVVSHGSNLPSNQHNSYIDFALQQPNGFDGLKIENDQLYVNTNRFKTTGKKQWELWKDDADMETNVYMMFKYAGIIPNPQYIENNLPGTSVSIADLVAGFVVHDNDSKVTLNKDDIKRAIIKVSKKLSKRNETLCQTVCKPVAGGAAAANKNKKRTKKRSTTKKVQKGGTAYTIGEPDSHTVIGFSNNDSFFSYNQGFGPMRDPIRQAILDKNLKEITDEYDSMSKLLVIQYVITGVLNPLKGAGSRPIDTKLHWLRGAMFMAAYNWIIAFQNALNTGIYENQPFIRCTFVLVHLPEDTREFAEDSEVEQFKDRKSFQNSFNEYINTSIKEHNLPETVYKPLQMPPDKKLSVEKWRGVMQHTNMIFFHGGETHWLNRRLKKTGLMEAIKQNKQLIYSGSSAGIINCGVTTALAATKRYNDLTNVQRKPLEGGDDPLVVLKKDGTDALLGDVFPKIVNTREDNLNELKGKPVTSPEVQALLLNDYTNIGNWRDDMFSPPYNTCDFDGIGVYPGIVFPHVTDDDDVALYHELIEQELKSYEDFKKNYPDVKHIEILADMHMFLYHKGVSTTYPPIDYRIGTKNAKAQNDMIKVLQS